MSEHGPLFKESQVKAIAALMCCLALWSKTSIATAADYPEIVYSAIEGIIRDKIRDAVDGTHSGTESCPTIFCPDADWRVTIRSDFRFTRAPQPTMTPLGPSPWLHGFRVSVDAQADVSLYADAYIDIHGPARNISFDVRLNKLVGIHMSAIVYTKPRLEVEPNSVMFSLTPDDGNVEIHGLGGDLTILGIEAGAVAGLIIAGNPLTGGILGAMTGIVAADKAKDRIRKETGRRFAIELSNACLLINDHIRAHIVPAVQRMNSALSYLPSLM